jgi:hypothetical protein
MIQMQYLVSVIDDGTGPATPKEDAAIDAFNDRLQAERHWVFAGGLGSPDTATLIDNRDGEAVFTDGPFLESKEYLGGFYLIDCENKERAIELAAQIPDSAIEGLGVEVRQVMFADGPLEA